MNYKHVSSTYNSLLFPLIFWAHLSIILLIKSKSLGFIRELYPNHETFYLFTTKEIIGQHNFVVLMSQ